MQQAHSDFCWLKIHQLKRERPVTMVSWINSLLLNGLQKIYRILGAIQNRLFRYYHIMCALHLSAIVIYIIFFWYFEIRSTNVNLYRVKQLVSQGYCVGSMFLIFAAFSVVLCCVVFWCFVCPRPVYYAPNISCFSGLSIADCPFGFL